MLFKASEGTAARRRAPIGVLVDATDGFTPELGEAAGQPQISKNGGAFGNTSATLTAVSSGLYYIELTAAELDTPGKIFLRYKSAATREHQSQFDVVAYDPFTAGSVPASAAEVWANATRTLTQSGIQVTAMVVGATITVLRGDTLSITLTGIGNITGNTKLWFTVKASDVADSASQLQVERSVGLLYVNGSAGTAGQGSITVNDAATGNITIGVLPAASSSLVAGNYSYDVQALIGGAVTTLVTGRFDVTFDISRAVS